MGKHRLRATGPDRSGQVDHPVRGPDRPLMLDVVLLFLRVARLGIDRQSPALEANVDRVMVGTGDGDGHGELVTRLVHVDRRRFDSGLAGHHKKRS